MRQYSTSTPIPFDNPVAYGGFRAPVARLLIILATCGLLLTAQDADARKCKSDPKERTDRQLAAHLYKHSAFVIVAKVTQVSIEEVDGDPPVSHVFFETRDLMKGSMPSHFRLVLEECAPEYEAGNTYVVFLNRETVKRRYVFKMPRYARPFPIENLRAFVDKPTTPDNEE